MTPGIHVRVVNSYAAATDAVSVNFVKIVDLPTDGNLSIVKNTKQQMIKIIPH